MYVYGYLYVSVYVRVYVDVFRLIGGALRARARPWGGLGLGVALVGARAAAMATVCGEASQLGLRGRNGDRAQSE